ncbi:MAG TPA: DUF2239 domain-containing protein, partial [Stenotrophomonas sp.]|nr:DUF2239 domain-containing protein [Stenotrophomonas sp.]
MNDPLKAPHALFDGSRLLVRGELREVVREAAARAGVAADGRPLLLLDDRTGQSLDLDLRGDAAQVLERLGARFPVPD